MTSDELKLGADIDAYCSHCKLELGHKITVIAEGKIVKVTCNTCGFEHANRGKPTAKKTTTRKRRSAKDSKEVAQKEFMRLLGNRNLSNAKLYKITSVFEQGDLIEHNAFGIGIITAVKDDNKITAMFKDKLRVLVHNR